MGFGEQLTEIIARLPENRQTLLFSATLPKVLVQFARAGLSDPVLIRLTYFCFLCNIHENLIFIQSFNFFYIVNIALNANLKLFIL